jgi:hypothetical protein
LGLAQHSVQVAPHSERAWISLCRTNFELSAGTPESPYFSDAIKACTKGAEIPYGASALASLVVLKAIDGETSMADWDRLGERMQRVTMSPSNVGVALYLAGYSNHDDRIDPRNVVRIIDIVGLDKQADGGTHVLSTAEVGAVRVTGTESKGKDNKRIRLEVTEGSNDA